MDKIQKEWIVRPQQGKLKSLKRKVKPSKIKVIPPETLQPDYVCLDKI